MEKIFQTIDEIFPYLYLLLYFTLLVMTIVITREEYKSIKENLGLLKKAKEENTRQYIKSTLKNEMANLVRLPFLALFVFYFTLLIYPEFCHSLQIIAIISALMILLYFIVIYLVKKYSEKIVDRKYPN